MAKQQANWSPYDNNGGTCVAIAGADYCVVAADSRLSSGYNILTREYSKICKLADKCVMASSGFQADVRALQKVLEARHLIYQHQHNKQMSCPAMAQLLSNTLYYKRFFPYYAFNVLGGLDNEGKGCIFTYDAVGSYERGGYSAQGSGAKLIISFLDNQLKSPNPLLLLAEDAVTTLSEAEAKAIGAEATVATVTARGRAVKEAVKELEAIMIDSDAKVKATETRKHSFAGQCGPCSGHYAHVTQQPLRGRGKQGGQQGAVTTEIRKLSSADPPPRGAVTTLSEAEAKAIVAEAKAIGAEAILTTVTTEEKAKKLEASGIDLEAIAKAKATESGKDGSAGQGQYAPVTPPLGGTAKQGGQWDAVTPLSEAEAIDLVKTCFASATERDIYTGDKLEIVVLKADGMRWDYIELRKD